MVWQGKYDKLFIGGEWVSPATSERIPVVSPTSEEKIAEVPAGAPKDVDRAVAAAREAFDSGPWPRLSLEERSEHLRRLSEVIEARVEIMAELVTEEMGCPITLSKAMQAAAPRVLLNEFIEMAPEYNWSELRQSATGSGLVMRHPIGVVAAVVPWNAPFLISMIKLAPAMLAGCTMVLKPAPETPLDAYLLAEMIEEAGLPKGVLNVVPADREVSEYLVMHPGVDKVTFTGSSAAGSRIGALCGADIRRLTLELGGKSAALILDDADVAKAVECLRMNALRNSGQVCSNKTRILVSKTRRSEVLEALASMMQTMPVGDPRDPDTQIGPMVSKRQQERVEAYIAAGKAEGAQVVFGGERLRDLDRGWFVAPTLFADVTGDMTIAQEEIFGPVLSVLTYEDEENAIAIANDSIYGLNGSIFTGDAEHGLALARRIKTGTVELNGCGVGFNSPIGGFKKSGIGREAGFEGFDAYVETQSVGLPPELVEKLSR